MTESIQVYTDRCLTCGRYSKAFGELKKLARHSDSEFVEKRLETREDWQEYYKLVELIAEKRDNAGINPVVVFKSGDNERVEWLKCLN